MNCSFMYQVIHQLNIEKGVIRNVICSTLFLCYFCCSDKGMLWRDVAGCYSDQLGTILNPVSSNDWSVLAGNLGYSPQEIGNFRLEKKSAAQFMLLDWGTTNESTVYRLYQALKRMRRDDAADTLLPLLTESDVGSMV